ncbi:MULTISPECIES: response regulator [unclassified Meiothermus]|uniref:response regulator n=1 Tax=unclassified Meiothermus TaxID=370471 RepID=UPI000D7C1324|nr:MULTISPECIES: response regulator [unclassified Meiothermus]PZA06890.1 response regulator receiver protein [Meiothermus sp. Pnk-1]RYM30870.1 response regulator [Meiothermus sp. PNK-Is4]
MPKVLVVDDSVSVRKALERILAPKALVVSTANSAEQALEQITHDKPDLIIADVIMPGLSGFDLCELIRRNPVYGHVPVILISGIVDAAVLRQAEEAGAFSVVRKPFTPEDLLPRVEAALARIAPAAPVAPEPARSNPTRLEPAPGRSSPEEYLRPFLEKPEVGAALLVSRKAEVLGQVGQTPVDPGVVATYVRTLASIAGALGEHLGGEGLQGVSLEYRGHSLFVAKFNEESYLVLLVQSATLPGTVRYLVQKVVAQPGALSR